jgi:sialate O-acetylesterase
MIHQTFRRPRFYVPLLLIALAFAVSTTSYADVTLPSLLADHMVVQRGLPVHLWGMAAPAESVAVTFAAKPSPPMPTNSGAGACTCLPARPAVRFK